MSAEDRQQRLAHAALMRETLAVVLAGGRGVRLGPLTRRRAKPAVPFGGRYRIVDFALSNCVNSGIRRVAVITQYMAQSLLRQTQESWNFLDARVHEFVEAMPAQQRQGESWYLGTADAVYQNADLLQEHQPRLVLVLAGDHIYRMDYARFIDDHIACGADISVACIPVVTDEASHFGVVTADATQRIRGFVEKPADPLPFAGPDGRCMASMGIYIFPADLLYAVLEQDAHDAASSHDFGRDLLPKLVQDHHVHAHDFAISCVSNDDLPPYWRDVGTIDAFYEANIDLTRVVPELNLYDPHWPILSSSQLAPPAKFLFSEPGRHGVAYDSLVSNGSIISGGVVRGSLIATGVRVNSFCEIDDSVVMPDVHIGRHSKLRRVIVDRRCEIPPGTQIGFNAELDRRRFHVSEGGVTVVTQSMFR
jgi:glucose-1-phosphate adenylyltransferase